MMASAGSICSKQVIRERNVITQSHFHFFDNWETCGVCDENK